MTPTNELTTHSPADDNFYAFLTKAFAFHITLIILAFLLQKITGLDLFHISKDAANLNIIQSSIRVDIVAMPKFTVQELKTMKIAPAESEHIIEVAPKPVKAKPIEIKKDDIVIQKKVKKKVDLSSLLSNLSKKKTQVNKKRKKKGIKSSAKVQTALRKLILEGNQLSKGTAIVGDGLKQATGIFNTYVSSLPHFVRPYWKLPSYLMDRNLQCRIRIYIGVNGKIIKSEVYESSGDSEFDRKALSAVKQVKDLPPPEKEILSKVASGEVILGFPL